MRRVNAIATAMVVALMVALAVNVAAQQPDTRDRTIMTFSAAVELPGMRLQPGTYVFRLADTASRNVIQVLSQDEMQILGQWLFVPAERQEVTGDTVVTFRETAANTTPAVQFWFYPGEKIGKEFIYPKDQALRIAQRTGATVLTEDGPITAGAQGAGVVEGSGLPDTRAEATATTGTSGADQAATDRAPADTGTGSVPQEGTSARNQTFAEGELPQTGSPLAVGGLIALLSLAGAAGLRAFRR